SRLLFASGGQLPAVAQRLDVARGIRDRRRTGRAAVDRLDTAARVKLDGQRHRNGRIDRFAALDMHGVELVGLDLHASRRSFTLDGDRLEAVLGKLRLQRLFPDARHWPAIFWPPNSPRASYRPQGCVLNSGNPGSRCEPGAAPSAVLRAAIRGYGFRG